MESLTPAVIEAGEVDGRRHYRFQNPWLSFGLTPALGGKITDLVSRPSGRSWLWRNPRLPQRTPAPGRSYIHDFDTGGWDEVFPTIGLCASPEGIWTGANLTHHGELWCRPGTVEERLDAGQENGRGAVGLRLSLEDPALPVHIEKEVWLASEDGAFEFRYLVHNRAAVEVPYIWCSHPLFEVEAGMRLRLPEGTRMRCEACRGLRDLAPGAPVEGLELSRADGAAIDLRAPADGPDGWAAKLFTERLPEGWVEWQAPDGERLRMEFDPEVLPHLGLWLNLGGWTGTPGEPYRNIGIEPGTSPFDSLFTAEASGTARTIQPGEEQRWSIRCRFLPAG